MYAHLFTQTPPSSSPCLCVSVVKKTELTHGFASLFANRLGLFHQLDKLGAVALLVGAAAGGGQFLDGGQGEIAFELAVAKHQFKGSD